MFSVRSKTEVAIGYLEITISIKKEETASERTGPTAR
jgi:hypothetical protein